MHRPKAYSYTRMSTVEQLKGDSRRRQVASATRYAAENGLEIVDRFDDWGVSAFRGKNAEFGALKKFKELVDSGDVARGSYLLVESMDRLSRQNVPSALALLTEIINQGIVLVTIDDKKIYSKETISSNWTDLIVALALMARAHEESKRKSGLLTEVWGEKKRLARTEGLVSTKKVPGWLTVSSGRIEEFPERAEVVREIFALVRDGCGAFTVCRRLNERKEPVWSNRKNAVWRESYIKKIIKSRTVLGEYQPHRIVHEDSEERVRIPDGDPILGYYPVVVSKELFHEANLAMDRRKVSGRGRKGLRYSNLFSGLLRCSCGAGCRYIDKGAPPKGGKYLQCSVAYQKGSCNAKAVRYALVENLLLNFIESLDVERVLGGERRNVRLEEQRSLLLNLTERRDADQVAIRRLVKFISSNEGPPSPALSVELNRVETEYERIKLDIEKVEREIVTLTQINPAERRRVIDELLERLQSNSVDDAGLARRALVGELQRMLKKVVLKPNVRVAWELTEADPNWMKTYNVSSMAGLERTCRDLSFELVLIYQNGDTSAIDAMDGPYFRSKGRLKIKEWTFLGETR